MSRRVGIFSQPNFRDNPYPYYARLRNESPVHLFEGGFWGLSRHHDVTEALKRPELFSSHTGTLESTPIGEDPPLQTRLRKAAHKILYSQKLSFWEERIREIVHESLEEAQSRGRLELFESLGDRVPMLVIMEILGLPARDFPSWFQWVNQQHSVPALEKQLAELPIWDEDLKHLSAVERIRFARLILIAATETSRNLIGNATLALLRNPDQADYIRQDKQRLPQLVEEALRYDTPVQMIDRRTTKPVEIHGMSIPAGATVFMILGSANRDPEVFEEPDRFLVARDASKHVAFGEGPHFCLGAQLARLEAQVVLESLLFRFTRLTSLEPLDQIQYLDTFKVRGLTSLHLQLDAT